MLQPQFTVYRIIYVEPTKVKLDFLPIAASFVSHLWLLLLLLHLRGVVQVIAQSFGQNLKK